MPVIVIVSLSLSSTIKNEVCATFVPGAPELPGVGVCCRVFRAVYRCCGDYETF